MTLCELRSRGTLSVRFASSGVGYEEELGNEEEQGVDRVDIGVRAKLAALWATYMFLSVYADFLYLYQPGKIEDIRGGLIGPFDVSQAMLLIASVLVIVPALMIFLSLVLPASINRWTNIAAGAVYTLISIANVLGETWIYYWLFGMLEVVIFLLIIRYAWKSSETAP